MRRAARNRDAVASVDQGTTTVLVDRRVGLKAITGVDADEVDRIVPPPAANRRQVRQRDAI
jgi:hypothetical protein